MVLSVASSADNGMTVVLLVLCATVIMIMLLRRHQFRGTTRRDMARDHIARVRDQHQLHQSMDELLVQLEEVSRSVDDRIARLEGVLGHSSDERAKPGVRSPRDDTGTRPQPRPEENHPIKSVDPRFQHVYDLVDAGASAIKAAQQLNMPLGEVELILNLRNLR